MITIKYLHKLVLSACSDYFKNIFRNNDKHQHPLLCLNGLSSKDLANVLDYMYNGKVQIFQNDLDRFLVVARRSKLEGLGGEDQDEEKPYDDSNYSFKEEENNQESHIKIVESEKKVTYKPRRPVKKVEGAETNTEREERNARREK